MTTSNELGKGDYKNVHQAVATLESAGLILREGRKLAAAWDELQASVSLLPAYPPLTQ